ncbi:MAG: PorV/PorQ family protein [Elusimicrobia bacterium]|nr:PorV/PorQ family protein [Candidatus Liberimonas magnetica]
MKNFILMTLMFLCLLSLVEKNVFADSSGSVGGELLKLDLGERAIGMGGAFCAVSDNVTAIHWNPAGLAQLNLREISLTQYDYVLDMPVKYLGFAYPLNKNHGVLGVQFVQLTSDDIYRDDNASLLGKFTDEKTAVTLSYSLVINDVLLFGINLNTLYSRYDTYETSGAGVDMGLLYKTPVKNLKLGVVVKNIDASIKFTDDLETIPLNLTLGASYALLDKKLILALDTDIFKDAGSKLHLGCEYNYAPVKKWDMQLSLRVGYQNSLNSGNSALMSGVNTGFGIRYKNYSIDYVSLPYNDFGTVARTSLSVRF